MSYRYAKVIAACKTCKAREYETPRGRTNDWDIRDGQCAVCREEGRKVK